MALSTREAKKILYRGIRIALIFFVWTAILAEPLKPYILPPLKQYVSTHKDFLLNLLLYFFIICSLVLMGLLYWLFNENEKFRRTTQQYISKLICRDYYKDSKKIDLEHFMAGNLIGQPSRTIQTDSEVGEQKEHSQKNRETAHDQVHDDVITQDGIHNTYYKSGRVKSTATYKAGKLEGALYTYYEDGRVHHEKHYNAGKLEGVFKAYDENGILYFEINYKHDKQDGLDKMFHKNGAVQYEDTYKEGVRIKRKTFDETGSLLFEQSF